MVLTHKMPVQKRNNNIVHNAWKSTQTDSVICPRKSVLKRSTLVVNFVLVMAKKCLTN